MEIPTADKKSGIGHDLREEAPEAFASAIMETDGGEVGHRLRKIAN